MVNTQSHTTSAPTGRAYWLWVLLGLPVINTVLSALLGTTIFDDVTAAGWVLFAAVALFLDGLVLSALRFVQSRAESRWAWLTGGLALAALLTVALGAGVPIALFLLLCGSGGCSS